MRYLGAHIGRISSLCEISLVDFVSVSFICYTKNIMRIALTTFLIIGFVGVAVFSVFAMNHNSEHGYGGCIAAAAQRVDCLKDEGVLSLIAFHLDAFRSFSTATFVDTTMSILLLLTALIYATAVGIIAHSRSSQILHTTYHHPGQFLDFYSFLFQQKLVRWLALHENSPSAA